MMKREEEEKEEEEREADSGLSQIIPTVRSLFWLSECCTSKLSTVSHIMRELEWKQGPWLFKPIHKRVFNFFFRLSAVFRKKINLH